MIFILLRHVDSSVYYGLKLQQQRRWWWRRYYGHRHNYLHVLWPHNYRKDLVLPQLHMQKREKLDGENENSDGEGNGDRRQLNMEWLLCHTVTNSGCRNVALPYWQYFLCQYSLFKGWYCYFCRCECISVPKIVTQFLTQLFPHLKFCFYQPIFSSLSTNSGNCSALVWNAIVRNDWLSISNGDL